MNLENSNNPSIPFDKSIFIFIGVFFVSMSVLIFQVALTRIFAIQMWYHFVYLIISLALLGFGASGTLLTIFNVAERTEKETHKNLASFALFLGLGILISFFLVTRININSFSIWQNPKDLLGLLVIFTVLSVPFLMGGMTIGLCLAKYSQMVGKLYCIDLIGAAIGAISCPVILSNLGLIPTVTTAAVSALLGALMFLYGTNRILKTAVPASLIVAFIMTIGFSGGNSLIPAMSWNIPFAPNKKTWQEFPGKKSDKVIPNAVAQVDISAPLNSYMGMGGEFGSVDKQLVTGRIVTQDGTAPTFLYKEASDLKKFPSLDDTQAGTAYLALNSLAPKNPDVMVIGVGGGIDVMIALFHKAATVTAVEINRAMIQMVIRDYADFIGHLFDNPKVTLVHEDGRSYLERVNRKYDIIQLSGVDTFTALSTGAYTLSESYLYTVEAITKMYNTLKEGGYINYSRFLLSPKPRETIRLTNIAYTALKDMGIEEPWRNIAVFQGHFWASTIIRKGPFSSIEIKKLEQFAKAEEFEGLIFNPLQPPSEIMNSKSGGIPRIQRYFNTLLRGSDSERNICIKGYDYNLSPSTDDKPFFFNYFKIRNFFNAWKNKGGGIFGEYLPDFPVGHMVLASSLFLIIMLAIILILLPLKFLPEDKIDSRVKFRTFIYFSSLGAGFMLIEICMMQKFILFLGHPVYSMSIVLAGILSFSGFGALFSSRISNPDRPTITRIMIVITAFSIFNAFALTYILQPMQSQSLNIRIIITLIINAPAAFVLGMPFPLGIRMLEKKSKELIPWGWAINGFLSVLSSILATVIAMMTGFSWVLIIAAMIYVIGLSLAPVTENSLKK